MPLVFFFRITKGNFLERGQRGKHVQLIYENYYRTLGQNIAFYRNRRRLNQLQLSEAAGISRNHLSRIENADCAVSLDAVFAIANALGVEPYKLFQEKE